MTEISLHILDIAENSAKAKASLIEITVSENVSDNLLSIVIKDNGCGMDDEFLKHVADPFCTTRKTRKIGLGISMFKFAAIQTGGSFDIKSKVGIGTAVTAVFIYDSVDRQPLGDMASTMITLIGGHPDIDFVYSYKNDKGSFTLDTREIRKVIGEEISLSEIDVLNWISDNIINETKNLCGGAI